MLGIGTKISANNYEYNIHITLQKENGQNIMDIVISLILYGETLKMQW